MLQIKTQMIKFIIRLDDVRLKRAHALFNEMQKDERAFKHIRIDAQVIKRDCPNRIRADIYTNLAQVLDLCGQLRKRVESYRANCNVSKCTTMQLTDSLVVAIEDRNRLRTVEIVEEPFALSCWF